MPGDMDGWVPVTQPTPTAAPANDGWVPVQQAAPAPAAPAAAGWQPVQQPGQPDKSPAQSEPQLNFAHFKSKYAQQLDDTARRVGIDPKMLRAVHFVEDASEDPNVISSAGAIGEMQMMPGTFKQFASKGANITDPAVNIDAGAMYLSSLMHRYGGNIDKVLTAYNAGPEKADKGELQQDYIAKYHAIYNSLTQDNTGPGHPAAPLSKGGKPPSRAVPQAPAPAVAASTDRAVYQRGDGEIKPAPSGVAGAVEGAGDAAEQSLRKAAANIQDTLTLTDDQRAFIQKIGKYPAVEGIATGSRIVQDLVMMPFSGLDAVMRDVASGNTQAIGDVGQRIWSAFKDPGHMGDFLDQLTEKYGPATRSENLWWANQPGFRQMIAKATPRTPEGMAIQAAMGLNADVHRYLLNKQFLSGGVGFMLGMAAPVGPEMALIRGAGKVGFKVASEAALKPIAKAVTAAAPKAAANVATKYASVTEALNKGKDRLLSEAPIVGDRFYAVHKQFGEVGENKQRKYVTDQSESDYSAWELLGQEDKLGGATREQRLAIHREADKFFNPHTTLHVDQPTGGDPYFDPITQTTTMNKGPAWGAKVKQRQVVYAEHPSPNLPGEPVDNTYPGSPTVKAGKPVKQLIFGGDQARIDNFDKHVKKGLYASAMRMVPGMTAQDADAFAAQVDASIANIKGKRAQATAANDMIQRKVLGHWAVGNGHDAVELVTPHGTQVIMPRPIKAMARDTTMIGNVETHDRAVGFAHVMHTADQTTTSLSPSLGGKMLDGYIPRGGMFAQEQGLLEKLEPDTTLKGAQGGTAGANPVGGKKREYGSIDHALQRGEQIHPEFDPAVAAQQSLARSLRFHAYMRYVLNAAKQTTAKGVDKGSIDYDLAVQRAVQNGRLRPPMTNGAALPQLGKGPAGRKAFEKWIADEASYEQANGPNKVTPKMMQSLPQEQILEGAQKAQAKLHQAVQEQFEADHPDLIWNADQELGVEDLAGLTVPKVIRNAAIDGHPVLNQQAGQAPKGAWALRDAPENKLANAVETLNNASRTIFMLNPLYHPFKNLARLAFGFGHLNPLEIAQGLLAPHTIDDALLKEAEEMGATSRKYNSGPSGPKTRAKYAYSTPKTYDHTPKGIVNERLNPSNLKRRIGIAIDGYKNVAFDSGPNKAAVAMHVLGKAMYNSDRWNTDWTFGVWEDAMAALSYRKLRDMGIKKGMKPDEARAHAANETRRIMGDTGNLTPLERRAGLQRVTWFYAWLKGQWRLWSRIAQGDPRALKFFTAQTYGLRTANEASSAPNPQDYPEDLIWGYDGDKPLLFRVGGGYMTKAEGIASLATIPMTGIQGAMDFRDAVADDSYNAINPNIRNIIANMSPAFGFAKGQEPSPWGPATDRDLPTGDMLQRGLGNVVKGQIPSEAESIKKAVQQRDPRYLLDLLGIPAREMNSGMEAMPWGVEENKARTGLEQALRKATSNADREALKRAFAPLIEQAEDARAPILGH